MNPLKTFTAAGLGISLLAGPSLLRADQAANPPTGYAALPQWAGEWESDSEVFLEPGKPPVKAKGKETSKMVGPHWLVSEGTSDMMGMPYTVVTILGYDETKKKFVTTTVDAFSKPMYRFEGMADATGKILTLEGEGPNPATPGKSAKFREVCELKTDDHKMYTTSMQGPDGKWQVIFKTDFRRKK